MAQMLSGGIGRSIASSASTRDASRTRRTRSALRRSRRSSHASKRVLRSDIPVLVNLFGPVERVAWGMDREPGERRGVGETLAFLRQPEPPGGWREALDMLPMLRTVMAMKPRTVGSAPCQEVVLSGRDIDLGRLPVQTC